MSHTIRTSKGRNLKIITFKPKFIAELKSAHPNAVALYINKLLSDLKGLTGIQHSIDLDQLDLLNKELKQTVFNNSVISTIERNFIRGTIQSSFQTPEDLTTYNVFYNIIELQRIYPQ